MNLINTYYIKGIFTCLIVFSFLKLQAQVKYPTDSSFINTLSHQQKNNFTPFNYQKIDTTITGFQNYFARNTNGHLGLPSSPLLNTYQIKELGFNLYDAPYQNDVIKKGDVNYYQTKGPYATLTGIAGSKQEQAFKLLFSNTFKNKLNITLAFNRYSGIGFYKRQTSFTNNFYTSSNYTNKTNRVGYYAYFLFNKLKHQENGGIKNDTLFLNDTRINKQLLPTFLSNAKRDVRYMNANINPWFRLNKTEDSATLVSHFIDYELNYSGNFTKYFDNGIITDNYYNVFYHDTITTLDSTHWRTVSNGMHYTLKYNPLQMRLSIGVKNEYNKVHQFNDSVFYNNSANVGLFLNKEKYQGNLKADYIFSGSNATDFNVEVNNRYQTKKIINQQSLQINLNINYESRHPDFIYNTWYSNHYSWNNSFVATQKLQSIVNVCTNDKRFELGMIYQNTTNQIYLNEQAVPEQVNRAINNVSFYLHKELLLFKHVGLNLNYQYQTTSYQAIVSLPNHITNSSIFYQGKYKKALTLQVGFNATYYNTFNGLAYMPATNMYYVQTQNTVGNYPFIDFFLNVRIKPVRIFVKIDHLNNGLSGKNYSLTPGYLQNDRAFKFGINWLFFD